MVSCLLASLMKIRLNPPDNSEIVHLFLNRKWSFYSVLLYMIIVRLKMLYTKFQGYWLVGLRENFIGILAHLSRRLIGELIA